jgi:hypothetical protein
VIVRRIFFAAAFLLAISCFDLETNAASSEGPKLPSLPMVARVRLDVSPEHVIVLEEINLPKGDWAGGDLDLYVAFGAPGAPLALDASIVALADGEIESNLKDAGEPVVFDRAPHRPTHASLLVGSSQMAGVVLHVKEPAFRRAVSPGKMAAIRIRTLMRLPVKDAQDGREVIVRLGIEGGAPLGLGRLQLASNGLALRRVEAHLCGDDADTYPLSIAVTPKLPPLVALDIPADYDVRPPAAAVLAVRHASDDLCIRMW